MSKIPLPSIVEIHPDKDELIVINRYESVAVSKGTWRSSSRGTQFLITVYEIDGVITYTIHLTTYTGPEPQALYGRTPQYYKKLEYPINAIVLNEHFLIP